MLTLTHDPQATLDYSWDWTAWLDDSETITAHTVTTTAAVTLAAHGVTGGVVTQWIEPPATGDAATGLVICHIVTSAGREDDRSIRLNVHDR